MTTPSTHGIIPPIVTPLTDRGAVDTASLRRLVHHVLDGGVHGLFVLGSSGEGASLSTSARSTVVATVVEETGGRVPVVVGCLAATTDRTIEWARAAEREGPDAVVVATPYFIRVSDAEIAEHFRAVRRATSVPILAYEVPVATHHTLSLPVLEALADDGTIIGLKDSSLDDVRVRSIIAAMADRPDMTVLTGHEVCVDAALLAGADGAVPGLANVDPGGYVRLWEAAQAGDWTTARKEQERLARLMTIAAQAGSDAGPAASGLGGFKTALVLQGVIDTNVMTAPLTRLDEAAADRVAAILGECGLA